MNIQPMPNCRGSHNCETDSNIQVPNPFRMPVYLRRIGTIDGRMHRFPAPARVCCSRPGTFAEATPLVGAAFSAWRFAGRGLRGGILLSLCASIAAVRGELIPSKRLADWRANITVGVPGGIPTDRTRLIDVTAAPFNADRTGGSNASAAIQAAINAAAANDVVFLPAGRYQIGTILYIPHNKDNITVRGEGAATVLDARVGTVFRVGSGSDYQWRWPMSNNTIVAGLIKGSTTIELQNASAFNVGQMIQIAVDNQVDDTAIAAGATPTVSVGGYTRLRRQMTRVIAKTGNQLTIFPTIYFTPDPGLAGVAHVAQQQTDFTGIENMVIDGTNGQLQYSIMFEQCYGCWIKQIKVLNTNNYGVFLTNTLNCEVRECEIRERKIGGSNGAGILIGSTAGSLFEDNIIMNIFPAVEVTFSSMGNVFAYNLMENSVGGTLNTNHAPHNSFNLYEGNVTPNVQSDGYYGGASDDTFFRNWIHGTNLAGTLRTFKVSLNRFTRNYTIIGNIVGNAGESGAPYSFGNPNMGNSMFDGSSKATSRDFWRDWNATGVLSARTTDNTGRVTLNSGAFFVGQLGHIIWENSRVQFTVSTIQGREIGFSNASGSPLPQVGTQVAVFMGSSGYQELDLDVEATTLKKGNYNYRDRAIPANESVGADSLPPSLFRSTKPDYFGSLAWPAFDPFNPNPSFASIPAGYRYANGAPAPGTNVVSKPDAPSNLRIQ